MKKRIALISDHASPLAPVGGVDAGGQNIYVHQLAMLLAERGHAVDVFTRRTEASARTVERCGYRVIPVDAGPPRPICKEELPAWMPAFGDEVISYMRDRKALHDLVHAHFWMSGLVAERIRAELGVPYVMTFHALGAIRRSHQGAEDRFPETRIDVERQLVRTADRIIATCPSELDELATLYDADPAKVRMIPCGFDPEEMKPMARRKARRALNWSPEPFVILHVGRIVPRKGIDNLIRGFSRWRRQSGAEAKLVIAGGETRSPDLEGNAEFRRLAAIAREEGERKLIVFLGQRTRRELALLYPASDLFVTTPVYEPFGITPLEAMACGIPVVASCVGGLKFTVVDRRTGLLTPPSDPEDLARRIQWLYLHADQRRTFGREGRLRVKRSFAWPLLISEIEDVYRELQPLSANGAGR